LVIPGLPHHITQRGNRRQQTFFNDGDYAAYVELMADWCREEVGGNLVLLPYAQSRSLDGGWPSFSKLGGLAGRGRKRL
jgi:hypothetical protein